MRILDFREAFKILEIEPTSDKKKIKVAYSKMLKKFHPEEFPEMFMRINEVYEMALGYVGSSFSEKSFEKEGVSEDSQLKDRENNEKLENDNFFDKINEYERDSIEDLFYKIFNSDNNLRDKNFFDEKEVMNKSISEWLEKFKNLLLSEKRTLEKYREILREFHSNFDVSEKNQIREILQKNGLRGYAWRNITRIEMELLIYNLNSDENFDILGETWIDSSKNENININLDEIAKKIKNTSFRENENGYEKFIQDYFNVKIFRLFEKNIALYPYRDIEQVGKTLKFITYKIRNEYIDVNNCIKIFGKEQKNSFGIRASLHILPYLWSIFGVIVIFLLFINPIVDWYIGIFGSIFFIILDWVNIAREKDFEWSMQYGYSSYLYILMSIIFIVNFIVISSIEHELPIISSLLYSQLIFQFVFLNIILFIKMVITTNIRYKRLKEFSKKVLDVFIFNK